MIYETIGVIGIVVICIAGLPQLVKTVKTKSVEDLSLPFFILILVGASLLLVYSFYIEDLIYIIGNILTILITVLLIACIVGWRK
ncbi:MAG: PQ-loop repeat-containing protein [Thermoplasmatales archaeon]|nr:PQ-loop repeat-containing protein [Thermoplasmatales archaeon]